MLDYTPDQCSDIKNKYCALRCYNSDTNKKCDELTEEWDMWLKGYKNCGGLMGPLNISQCDTSTHNLIDKYGLISVKQRPEKIQYINGLLAELEESEIYYEQEMYDQYLTKTSRIILQLINDYTLGLNVHELDNIKNMFESKYIDIIFILYPKLYDALEELSESELYEELSQALGKNLMDCIPSQYLILQKLWIIKTIADYNNISYEPFNVLLSGNICLTGQHVRIFIIFVTILNNIYLYN
jgi:GTPase SAR1 family protein